MIRALVVEDSSTVRELLLGILSSDPAIEVIGTAQTGEEAVEAVERFRPDVVTMDALQTILAGLPKDFPVPVLIVQHIADGFTQYFVEWLAQSSKLPVHLPTHGQGVLPGHVYVAPDRLHMAITADGRIQLVGAQVENGLRPSVSYLFRSVAKAYGPGGVGVLLTGMGRDGAWELKSMKEEGAVTIVQDRDTSAVYGMPGEAIRLGGATYVLSPEKIHRLLANLAAHHAGYG